MQLGLLFSIGIDTEAQVLAILANQQGLLVGRPPIMEQSSEGSSYSRQFAIPPETVIAECKYFLRQVNPARYGRRNTKSRPFFC